MVFAASIMDPGSGCLFQGLELPLFERSVEFCLLFGQKGHDDSLETTPRTISGSIRVFQIIDYRKY